MPSPKLFVSYRRSRLETVRPAVDALRAAGIECFFDLEDIDPLADFPQRIREGIDGAHALLAWWSVDYGESAICLAEFRRGWQHARRSSSDIGRRVWVLNPEARGDHIFAGELNAKNFLVPPAASATDAWVLSIRQRLDALVPEGPLADERRRQAATARRNVPRASTEFTGRGASLLRMHSKLFPPQLDSSGASPGVQLFGMGGVGKSEVAAMYADTFAAAYPGGIFWLNLSSFEPGATLDEAGAQRAWHGAVESVLADDPDLQRRLMRDAAGRPLEPRSARALISQWLPGATPDQTDPAPYLWIVDNVPSMSPLDGRERILEFWRAPTAVGRTLLTTRDSRSMAGFVAEPLEVLDDIEALRLLSRYRAIGIDERGAAEALAREVGCHTLALTLLGERLRESDGYPAALDRLQATGRLDRLEQVAQLLRPELGERARSVVATFELSIAPLAPAAKQLLALAALCVPGRPIPQPLLGTAFGEARSDAFAVAMTSLLRASLLTRRHGEHAVEIHPLVADVAADLSKADTEAQRGRLVDALIVPLPAVVDVRKHRLLEDYVVHACQLVSSAIRTMAEASLLGWVARFDQERGNYASAERLVRRQVDFYSETVGWEARETLFAAGDLARAALALGRTGEAVRLCKLVLDGRKRLLGPDDIDTLTAAHQLAVVLKAAGKQPQALRLHKRVLELRRRVLGPTHEHTLFSMNNYGATLAAAGRFQEAQPFLEEAYRLRRELHGADHADTLGSAATLARVLFETGDSGRALELAEDAARANERILGDANEKTMASRLALATLMDRSGNRAAAVALMRQIAESRARTLGNAHPNTLLTLTNLGVMMIASGQSAEAKPMLEQALLTAKKAFGANHETTLVLMNNLGKALLDLGELPAAQPLLEQATALQTAVAGTGNHFAVRFAKNLYDLYLRQGAREQADALFVRQLRWLVDADPEGLDTDRRETRERLLKSRELDRDPRRGR